MTRTGKDYLNRVRDGRAVFLDGQLIEDPADAPAFHNAARGRQLVRLSIDP